MAVLRFFKLPKHQQYEYKPRYWDPRKEEMEERLKRLEKIQGNDAEAAKARIAGGFRRGFEATGRRTHRGQVMRSNIILLAIIVFLILLSYLLLNVYLPEIVDFIETDSTQLEVR